MEGMRKKEEGEGKLTGSPGTLLETVVWGLFELARTAEWRGEGPTRRCLQLVGVVPPRLHEGNGVGKEGRKMHIKSANS